RDRGRPRLHGGRPVRGPGHRRVRGAGGSVHLAVGQEHGELRPAGGAAAGAAPGSDGRRPEMSAAAEATPDQARAARAHQPRGKRQLAIIVALGILVLALPFVGSSYLLSVATLALYLAYVGQAWNVMMGF